MSKINLYFEFETSTTGGSSNDKKTKKSKDREPKRIEIESIKVSNQKNAFGVFWAPSDQILDADIPDDSGVVRIVMIRYYDANSYDLLPSYGNYSILPFLYKTNREHFDLSSIEERIEKYCTQEYSLTWLDYYAGVSRVEYFDINLESLENEKTILIDKEEIKTGTFSFSKRI